MYKKLKAWVASDYHYFTALLVMVGVSSFGLGLLSGDSGRVQMGSEPAALILSQPTKPPVEYVASIKGTSYHLPWCPGVVTIKEENLIRFASKEEAEKQGYVPAGNCPGI